MLRRCGLEMLELTALHDLQALGVNVMLIRSLLDAVGTFASALGSAYASAGGLLRVVLLPLLERLGDPSPAVALTAEEVLVGMCTSCNYTGLQDLVAQNLDYIVDGLCAQLRQIDSYPRCLPLHCPRDLLRTETVAAV